VSLYRDGSPAPRVVGVRILVVEDDPVFQRILHKRIDGEGYEVILASDGREGMRAIVAHEPQLVVSDWMMPMVDGLELCRAVKTGLGETAPYFILLTAKGEITDRLLALDTGADDYLVKPCDHGELMARIRAGLRVVDLNAELRRRVAELKRLTAHPEAPRDALDRFATAPQFCPACRRLRLPDASWVPIDEWLQAPGGARSPHPACPACREDGGEKAA
jgi:CheY-like chemotaxis protein